MFRLSTCRSTFLIMMLVLTAGCSDTTEPPSNPNGNADTPSLKWISLPFIGEASIRAACGTNFSDFFMVGNKYTYSFNGHNWIVNRMDPQVYLEDIWQVGAQHYLAVGREWIDSILVGVIWEYTGGNWRRVFSKGPSLTSITGTSDGKVFAVGEAGVIIIYDGNTWSEAVSGTTKDLHDIDSSENGIVLAVGNSGTILRFDNGVWTSLESTTSEDLHSVVCFSTELYYVGSTHDVFSFSSGTWTVENLPGDVSTILQLHDSSLMAISDGGLYEMLDGEWSAFSTSGELPVQLAWGMDRTNLVAVHIEGKDIAPNTLRAHNYLAEFEVIDNNIPKISRSFSDRVSGLAGQDKNRVLAIGSHQEWMISRPSRTRWYNGSSWSSTLDAVDNGRIFAAQVLDSGDAFAVGDNGLFGEISGEWHNLDICEPFVADLHAFSSDDIYVAIEAFHIDGCDGPVYHYNGSNAQPSFCEPDLRLKSVWGYSQDSIYVAGYRLGTSRGGIGHFDGTNYQFLDLGELPDMYGVHGSSPDNVFAVGRGAIIHFDGDEWTRMTAPSENPIYDVWVVNSDHAFAVGEDGAFIFQEGSWSILDSTTGFWSVWAAPDGTGFFGGDDGAVLRYGLD